MSCDALLKCARELQKMLHQTLEVKNVVMVFTNVDTIEGAPKKTGWYLCEAAHPYFVSSTIREHGRLMHTSYI